MTSGQEMEHVYSYNPEPARVSLPRKTCWIHKITHGKTEWLYNSKVQLGFRCKGRIMAGCRNARLTVWLAN